eukprot:s448_g2.t2
MPLGRRVRTSAVVRPESAANRRRELLIAGAGAGIVSKTITAPMDRIRILFQVHRKRLFSLRGFLRRGMDIVRLEGPLGLWRGNLAVVLQVMPYAGVQFMAFDHILWDQLSFVCFGVSLCFNIRIMAFVALVLALPLLAAAGPAGVRGGKAMGAPYPGLSAYDLGTVKFDRVAILSGPGDRGPIRPAMEAALDYIGQARCSVEVPPHTLMLAAVFLRLILIAVAEVQDYLAEAWGKLLFSGLDVAAACLLQGILQHKGSKRISLILLCAWLGFAARDELPVAMLLQTLAFVATNKVLTAQYFVWWLCLVPFVLPKLESRSGLMRSMLVWMAAEVHWLLWAYLLEFRQLPVRPAVWVASCLFLVAHINVLREESSVSLEAHVLRKYAGVIEGPACTGTGSIPAGPVCYGGSILTETFSVHVISHDGDVGIVDMKAVGPQSAECEGAQFQNDNNVISIENDHGCGLTNYEYSVEYCPDQDHLIINLVKPYSVRVVLDSQTCPAAGEV